MTDNNDDEVIKPKDVQMFFKISAGTRLNWEKAGRLPPRDVVLAGKGIGWRRSTLQNWLNPKRQEAAA